MSSSSKPVKRLVTGYSEQGKDIPLFDDEIHLQPLAALPHIFGGKAWVTEQSPANNTDQKTDMGKALFTERFGLIRTGGTNVAITELGPGQKAPMHRTNSIDYNVLISGQVTHILPNGIEHTFTEPGSIIIQRGTMHAWENRSETEPVRWITVLVDAHPAKEGLDEVLLSE